MNTVLAPNCPTKEHRVTFPACLTYHSNENAHNSTITSPRRCHMTVIVQTRQILITIYILKCASPWLEKDLFETKLGEVRSRPAFVTKIVRPSAPSL